MFNITDFHKASTWITYSIILYIITFLIVKSVRRVIRRDDQYTWATVICNLLFSLTGPVAIIIAIIVLFIAHDERDTHFKTKPPKWL